MIDTGLLESGDIDYNNLNNVYIIMIIPFDLFGKDEYMYTFKMSCQEYPGLELNDGTTRIFLNTHGKKDENVSKELVELLHYIEKSTDETDKECTSESIHMLHEKVKKIKASEWKGERFMHKWEERILDRADGKAEGLAEGRAEGKAEGLAEGLAEGKAEVLSMMVKILVENGFDDEKIITELEKIVSREMAEKYLADYKKDDK